MVKIDYKNSSTLELNALCGFPIYELTTEQLEAEGYLVPTKCIFIRNGEIDADRFASYNEKYDECIMNNPFRNEMAKKIVEKYGPTKKILILTRKIEHARILNEMIPNSSVIIGETDKDERKETFASFKNEGGFVIIGSSKIFSAGINLPDLDIICNMSGHKSSIDSVQIVGRVKRKFPGKKFGYLIDFYDENYFEDASNERIKILKEFGNEINIIEFEELEKIIQ